MATYIPKETALKVVEKYGTTSGFALGRPTGLAICIASEIAEIPDADVAPVVRCKDCKHYLIADEFDGGKRHMCEVNDFSYLKSDGDMHFCSYGKPKEKL